MTLKRYIFRYAYQCFGEPMANTRLTLLHNFHILSTVSYGSSKAYNFNVYFMYSFSMLFWFEIAVIIINYKWNHEHKTERIGLYPKR